MPEILRRFDRKVIIVTGAGSGIGAAAAQRFLEEGAMVALAGRDKAKLQETVAGFDPALYLLQPTDVSSEKDVKKLVAATIKKFGRLDVLVNNAGIAVMGKIAEVPAKKWHEQMATNLDGVYFCSKEAIPHLLETKGCIVNVASVSGLGGDENMSAYDASKGAIVNLTRAMAIDYGPQGVRVNSVCPTFTITPLTADMAASKKTMKAFKNRIPLGRPALPEDIAGPITFLASRDADFISGVNFPVDGGLGASNGQPIYYE